MMAWWWCRGAAPGRCRAGKRPPALGLPLVGAMQVSLGSMSAHAAGLYAHLSLEELADVVKLGQEADKLRAREAGFDHHLVKPVEPEALPALLDAGTAPPLRRAAGT